MRTHVSLQSTISLGGTYRTERPHTASVTKLDDDIFTDTNTAQYELSKNHGESVQGYDGSGGGGETASTGSRMPASNAHYRASAKSIMEGMGLGEAAGTFDGAVAEASEAASMKL